MRRRTFTHLLSVIAVVAALGLTQRCTAKPPDLPVNTENTVTPEFLPDSEWDGVKLQPKKVASGGIQGQAYEEFGERQPQKVSVAEAIAIALQQQWIGNPMYHRGNNYGSLCFENVTESHSLIVRLPAKLGRQFASTLLFGIFLNATNRCNI